MNITQKVLERQHICKTELLKLRPKDMKYWCNKDRNYVSIRLVPAAHSNSVPRGERLNFERAESNKNYSTFSNFTAHKGL